MEKVEASVFFVDGGTTVAMPADNLDHFQQAKKNKLQLCCCSSASCLLVRAGQMGKIRESPQKKTLGMT